ncbi:hypothetical protein PFLUV_G00107070 [Perca fluviatilis]|uniref:Putative nuclease HARBI1 n=1 Tax=Perca fluviatilis TaxID=8168 RepID=A0A6A5FBA7_PERFL|nr:hypothetical protein PFLUV_G00107070 [Perca fluviatilis]
MACPFIDEVMDKEALILRRAFRRERFFRDRSDPLAFDDSHLYERYRFCGDGIRYLCRLLGFPNVIGALDCTHIRIKRPSGVHEGDFVNRKSYHSINVQMICDADCTFSNVEAKWPGSVHDSRVFRASTIFQRLSQGKPLSFY